MRALARSSARLQYAALPASTHAAPRPLQRAAGVVAQDAISALTSACSGRRSSSGRARCSNASTSTTTTQAEQQQSPQQQQQQQQQQREDAAPPLQLKVQVISSMEQVPQAEWDALVAAQPEVNPFISWAFLHILEASGSAVPEEGWAPQHLLARDADTGQLLGAVPLYLKGHSYGEYVFDSSWANASHAMGQRYYPKLQSCVPFSPVTGPRLLVAPGPHKGALMRGLASALLQMTDEMGVSSLHVTFPSGEEWAALGAMGFQQRKGLQFHWENNGYASFECFLADLKQSKRKSIRQERKGVAKQGLTVKRLTGREVTPELWDAFHGFYLNTVERRWGSAYLTRDFWHMLGRELGDQVLLVVAEEGGEPVAAALNLVGSHCLYGRNWGCAPGKDYRYLHFELCYYQAIEEAIARGLPRVEAGAQGEHKLQRGYLPNLTYSAHYVTHPGLAGAVRQFLAREDAQMAYTWQALTVEGSPYKQGRTVEYLVDKMASYSSLSSADEGDASPAASSDGGSSDRDA